MAPRKRIFGLRIGAPLPVAKPIALPVALPIAKPIADQLTNIDTTDLTKRPGDFGMPTARNLDEVNPDPLWISRWQPTATVPPEDGPWVTGYRWWEAGVRFNSWGPSQLYRIDAMFNDGHRHGYADVPLDVWQRFQRLTSSVGQFLHEFILGPKGRGCQYTDLGAIS